MPDSASFYRKVFENIDDPYPVYREFREHGGIHRIAAPTSAREPEWVVLRHDYSSAVLSRRGFGRRAGVARGGVAAIVPAGFPRLARLVDSWLVFMDPPQHTRVRQIVADCVARRTRYGLRDRIPHIVAALAVELADETEVDMVSDFAAIVPVLVVLELLGVADDDREWLCNRIARIQDASSFRPGNRTERLATAEDAAGDLDGYFRTALAERRGAPQDDLMSALLATDSNSAVLTDDLLVGTCVHFLTAGHEATRSALAKAALLLLRNPETLDHLTAQPDQVPSAVDEFLRFDSPVQMVTRWAYPDERVGDRHIHRGDKVTIVVGAANRDPRRFVAPDVLRLGRDSARHCSFGMGAHYCLGSALGRLQTEAGVTVLLDLLQGASLAKEPIPYGREVIFHGPRRLLVTRS